MSGKDFIYSEASESFTDDEEQERRVVVPTRGRGRKPATNTHTTTTTTTTASAAASAKAKSKKPTPKKRVASESEDEEEIVTITNKGKKGKKVSSEKIIDLSEESKEARVPGFRAFLGQKWWARLSFYKENLFFALREWDPNDEETPGKGATLSIKYLDRTIQALTELQSHLRKHKVQY